MRRICEKCDRVMTYDPYFKADVCRQCGHIIYVDKANKSKTQLTFRLSAKNIPKRSTQQLTSILSR